VAGRQPPREGYAVSAGDRRAGEVTSGNFSPVLGCGIALGFLTPGLEPGAAVRVEGRGRTLAATVVKPPFVREGRPNVPVPSTEGA
jgi:aminomethyltransferase